MQSQTASVKSADSQAARLLHTMIRVRDLKKSLEFYTGLLGMKVLRQREVPAGKYSLAFVGYGEERDNAVIELTYNWGQEQPYELGTGFGHLAIGVKDRSEERRVGKECRL